MMDQRIARLLDRTEIIDCMARYTRGVDRHDVELMRSTFWPDAEIAYTNIFHGGLEDFLAWANPHHDVAYRNHQHHTTTHAIRIEGDVAVAEHYCLVMLQRHSGETLLSSGRYLQQFERRDPDGTGAQWRIAVREYMPEMSFTLAGRNAGEGLTPDSLAALYDAADGGTSDNPARWAPVPPSGPSRQDDGDLSYRFPLGRRAERDIWQA